MKKFKLFTVAMLIGTMGIFASENTNLSKTSSDIGAQIETLLDATEFEFQDTHIDITFTFSSEGEIVVLKVGSNDENVLNYVRENLNGKTIKNPGVHDKLYSIALNLKSV